MELYLYLGFELLVGGLGVEIRLIVRLRPAPRAPGAPLVLVGSSGISTSISTSISISISISIGISISISISMIIIIRLYIYIYICIIIIVTIIMFFTRVAEHKRPLRVKANKHLCKLSL